MAVVALYLVVQQIENNVLVPKVMQKATGLNPVVSIVALLVGVKVGGLVGAVLSIPVTTMAAVILEDLFRTGERR
jgi:predicted PurR-regulated permease PerM